MSGGHSEAWIVSCERPVDGEKRCRMCAKVKPWPSAFSRRQKCNECSDKHAAYVRQWRDRRAHARHQRSPSPVVGCVLPALTGAR